MKSKIGDVMLILGGYGKAGSHISRILLQETGLHLILAGRNGKSAAEAADRFNREFSGNRVRAMRVNARDRKELTGAFSHCDTVMICLPVTSEGVGAGIAMAAYEAGINYIDLNPDREKQLLLEELKPAIRESGRFFMTDVGMLPGVPSMLSFLAEGVFDAVESVNFGAVTREKSLPYGSLADLLLYCADAGYVYKDGQWSKKAKTASNYMNFGNILGWNLCYPMDLYELRSLPDKIHAKEIGCYAAGMNAVTDGLLFFWISAGLHKFKWSLRLGAKLIYRSLVKRMTPPFRTAILMEAKGLREERREELRLLVSHEDAFAATAIATAAAVLQLINGTIEQTGVFMMGHAVDPSLYVEEIKRLGMDVEILGVSFPFILEKHAVSV